MAMLTAVARGGGVSARGARAHARRGWRRSSSGSCGVGLLVVPRLVRAVVRLNRAETTARRRVGLCFAFALLAPGFGYSVALGAFIAGSLVAESGEAQRIEQLVHPVRDMFAAIFFVSVGMLIDPALVLAHWPARAGAHASS